MSVLAFMKEFVYCVCFDTCTKFLCDSIGSMYICLDKFVFISVAACARSMLMPTTFSAPMKTCLDHFSRFAIADLLSLALLMMARM